MHTSTYKYIYISAAILITGGDDTDKSSEVFLPWSNTSCQLPSLPDRRSHHVQAGNMVCGGFNSSAVRSCVKWIGGWVTQARVRLSGVRSQSSVWARDDTMVIMGGVRQAGRTSETVSSDGASTRRSFRMNYKTRLL